jgi:hypothetical protein
MKEAEDEMYVAEKMMKDVCDVSSESKENIAAAQKTEEKKR